MYTDHKNLNYENTNHAWDKVLRQRLLLEEYGCDIKFIEGKKNVVADVLSRLDYDDASAVVNESHLMK